MKLLKLPYLVVRQILEEIPLSVFFLLSLCSTRMRRILQNSKRRLLCVGMTTTHTTYTQHMYWGKERGRGITNMFILRTLNYSEFGRLPFCEPLPVLFDGITGWHSFGFDMGSPRITFVSRMKCIFQSDCHSYLNELFVIKNQLFHLSCPSGFRILMPNTVRNTIVSNCPTRRNVTLSYNCIDDFFKMQPERNLVIVEGKIKDASPVVPERLLVQAKNLVLEHPDNNNEYFLVHFQGEHLLVTSNGFKVFFVNLLIRLWLDRKKERLSTVIILTPTDMTENVEDILKDQGTTPFTKHTQNRMFPYKSE
ncbi:unnamed protein product [Caenorhabditis brenneri]